jgi:hypothetical protein
VTATDRRGRRLIALAIVVLVSVSCRGSHHASAPTSSGSTSTTSATSSTSLPSTSPTAQVPRVTTTLTTTTTAAPSPTTAAVPTTSLPLPPPSDGWAVVTFHAGPDAGGAWSGSARIRNASGTARASNFEFRLTRNGRVVATLTGLVSTLSGGSSSDVALSSKDRYTPGAYSYTFSASFGF